MKRPYLSIILPCYNEEEAIASTVKAVHKWVKKKKLDAEIIVVNDGSYDNSLAVLEKLQLKIEPLVIVSRFMNGGYGIAVRDGCDEARGEWIGFMDSDGQFDPQDFDKLLPFCGEYKVVTGRRMKRSDPLMRRIFGKILATMNGVILGLWIRDINCGMKIFHRSVWPKVRPVHGVEKLFNTEVFLRLKKLGIPYKQIPVPHYPRQGGKSTGGSVKVILRMFKELAGLRKAVR